MALDFQALLELLNRQCGEAERLGSVLETERDALQSRDADALEAAAREKQELVNSLEALGARLNELLRTGGFPPDAGGLDAATAAAPDDRRSDLEKAREALREQLQACRDQNEVNGRLIDTSNRATQQALALLLGGETGQTYDKDGTPSSRLGGKTSIKA